MLSNEFSRAATIRPSAIGLGTLILACVATLAACQPLFPEADKQVTIAKGTPYQRVPSPRGSWEVVLFAEAGWAFAPHTITVLRRDMTSAMAIDNDRGTLVTRFQLYNDGANLSDSNCVIAWRVNSAQEQAILTCDGQEQEPQRYEIDLATATLLSTTDPDAE